MFDSHIHLDFDELSADLETHLTEARALGVRQWFVPGCSPSQWPRLAALKRPDVVVGVGMHPYFTQEDVDVDTLMASLRDACLRNSAVAIGECGLDKGRGARSEKQTEIFEAQLKLAGEMELPVVVHQVGHREQFLQSLSRVGLPERGGVVHGFGGDAGWGRALMERGFLLGMGVALTKENHKNVRAAAKELPLDRLMIETDAPDQFPQNANAPGRPRDLVQVCEALSALSGRSREVVAEVTERTARSFFGLEPHSIAR